MDSVEIIGLARSLIDIDSTSGREAEACRWLAGWLQDRGYDVVEQPVADDRFNVIATLDPPDVVLSTHIDCVPPFFASREDDDLLYGRGACDAKGILAAQLAALERLRAAGVRMEVPAERRRQPGAEGPLAGRTYVLTGTLASMTREAATAAVERLGGKVAGSVSRKTAAVIAGTDPGSKAERARALGVVVLDEVAFLALIEGSA